MSTDPTQRIDLPESALFLVPQFPREGRYSRSDLCRTAQICLGNHRYFRQLLPQIDASLAAHDPFASGGRAFSDELSRQMNSLLGGLEGHHGVEDDYYFPEFRRAEPRLGPGFDVLDADHTFIHDAIVRLSETAVPVIGEFAAPVPTPGSVRGHLRDDLRGALASFEASLVRHLDDEEDLVIPFLLHRNGAERLAA